MGVKTSRYAKNAESQLLHAQINLIKSRLRAPSALSRLAFVLVATGVALLLLVGVIVP